MSEAAAGISVAPSSWLSRCARWPAASLLALCLLIWLPGFLALPPLDRDESRFAQSSKQMVETGDYVDIRFGEGVRYNKPAGIYWLQALATRLFGDRAHDQIWTYRFPSVVGGYLALLLLYWCARAVASPEIALAASVLLGSTVLMAAEAQIATTDAVLLALILAAQAVLYRVYLAARHKLDRSPGRGLLLAGWAAFAFGILVKGPVIAAVLGATALVVSLWDRDWRWLRKTAPLPGLLLTAAIVLPWAVAIALHSRGAFYSRSLGHDFASKIVSGQESHGAPPGYYLVLSTLSLWPATLFVAPALRHAWLDRAAPEIRYLLGWAFATWLMFELVPTKLPHYVLPAYPALALLAALSVDRATSGGKFVWDRVLRTIAYVQFAIGLGVLAFAAGFLPVRYGHGPAWPILCVAVIGCVAGGAAIVFRLRRRTISAAAASVVSAAILIPLLTAAVAPGLDTLWISSRAAALVARDRRPGDPPPVVAGYAEPSLVFLLGTNTRTSTGSGAAAIMARQGGLALIEKAEQGAFLAGLGALDTQAFAVDHVSGLDYSRGRNKTLTLYRVVPAFPWAAGHTEP